MNFSIIIEARLGSSRLPKKIIYKIKKYTFLEYLLKKLKKIKYIDEIIVATTKKNEDTKIVNIAKKNKVKFFRGSEKNVLKRVIDTGKKFNCENIIRITSDCPLVDNSIIEKLLFKFKKDKYDYISNIIYRSYPDGMDVEVFSLKALIKSRKYSNSKKSKEWITWNIRNNLKDFKTYNLKAKRNLFWPELGLTLDQIEDYKLLKKIISYFNEKLDISCFEIIKLLKKKNWTNINKNVKRNN